MALAATALYSLNAGGNNSAGAGFNTGNANFMTDLAATSATGNSPVVTSATYSFVATDDEHWVYVSTGTNWTPGFYQIASVSGGAATLRAAIGEGVQFNSTTGFWQPSTVAGCATVASPTGGTFGVDYSQSVTPLMTITDLVSTASTTVTSVTGGFTRAFIGNYFYLISATGADEIITWYEIVNFTDANTLVLDKVSGTYVAGAGPVGGSMALGGTATCDELFEIGLPGNTYFVKSGTLTTAEVISTAAVGSGVTPIRIIGFNSVRGDAPTASTRPTFACGANAFTLGASWELRNCIVTGTAAIAVTGASLCKLIDVKIVNPSTTTTREAHRAAANSFILNMEPISYRGHGIVWGATDGVHVSGAYCHASVTGITNFMSGAGSGGSLVENSILADNITHAYNGTGAWAGSNLISNCTLFGALDTRGTGLAMLTAATGARVLNSIISGFVTGLSHADVQTANIDDYCNFFNNDADVSNWKKGAHDVALDPQFINLTQVAGTAGAFVAGNSRLVDITKNFTALGVAVGDYVGILSGTGATAGFAQVTSIATTTNANDTLVLDVAVGTNTTTDKVYSISLGNNFSVGNASLYGTGSPGVFPGGLTTGYNTPGAVIPSAAQNIPVGHQST